MNIMSENEKYPMDDFDCDFDCDCNKPVKKHHKKECFCKCVCHEGPEPGKALAKCGCSGSAVIPVISAALLGNVQPIPVSSVTLDASELRCPLIIFSFTAEISATVGALLSLQFRIKKSSKGGCCEFVCGTHNFSQTLVVGEISTFAFQACDTAPCDECVTYTVEVIPTGVTVLSTINNASFSVIAFENIC